MRKVPHSTPLKLSYISEFKCDGSLSTDKYYFVMFISMLCTNISGEKNIFKLANIRLTNNEIPRGDNFLTQPTMSNERSEFNVDM